MTEQDKMVKFTVLMFSEKMSISLSVHKVFCMLI